MKRFLLFTLLAFTSSFAFANPYIGTDYTYLAQSDFSSRLVSLKFGNQGELFGIEGRVGTGIDRDNGIKVDYQAGVYGKFQLPTETIKPYMTVGYTVTQYTLDSLGLSFVDSEDGISYGAGTDIVLTEHVSMNAEYMVYKSHFNTDNDGITVGIKYTY